MVLKRNGFAACTTLVSRMVVVLMAVLGAAGVACGVQERTPIRVPADALVISNGKVIDGTGADPIPSGSVVVQGNRISAVRRADDLEIAAGAQVIDARGGTILPGIINSHVHHGGSVELRRRFLEEGVTTVCDLGSPWMEITGFGESRSAEGPAARGYYSGPIITAPGGYPDGLYGTDGFNYEVETAPAARAAVQDLVGRGATIIKIAMDPSWNFDNPLPMLDVERARSVVEEAHTAGLLVRAHMIQITYFPMALEAGVDVIEHMPFPTGWPSEDQIAAYSETADPLAPFFEEHFPQYQQLFEGMAQQGIIMVPTVAALLGDLYGNPELSQRQQYIVSAILDIVRRFRAAGGTVALGNDFNDRSVRERLPMTEMKALMEAGLTPMEVIEASTHHAARVCGQESEIGTLETGKLADIIVVGGDVLSEVDALTDLRWVVLDGEIAFGSAQ